jgi:hypothetical protein
MSLFEGFSCKMIGIYNLKPGRRAYYIFLLSAVERPGTKIAAAKPLIISHPPSLLKNQSFAGFTGIN